MMTARSLITLTVVLLVVYQVSPPAVLAQQANLDLSSTTTSVAAGSSGTIKVGGANLTVTSGTMLTPAESVALGQVLGGGTQNLVLDASGRATGGQFVLTGNNLSSVVIPTGVTAVRNFAQSGNLTVAGALVNSGNLFAVSSSAQVLNAVISAQNINNLSGGLLTSVLPQNGLSGFGNLISSLSLTLNAVQNIVNYGTISSSGNLNLNAGGSIVNAVSSSTMQAMSNVNMVASAIQNAGLVQSLTSNINISAAMTNAAIQNLSINGTGGTMKALNAINIGDITGAVSTNITMTGGNYLSNSLNLNAGCGDINVDVGDISGTVNANCANIHLNSTSTNYQLQLGTINYLDDPLITQVNGFDLIILQAIEDGDIILTSAGSITALCDIVSNNGAVFLDARYDITTQNVSAGTGVLLHAADYKSQGDPNVVSAGNLVTGNITANGSVNILSDNGTISYGAISAQNIGLQQNSATTFVPTLNSLTFTGTGFTSTFSAYNMGTGGVLINQDLSVRSGTFVGGSIDIEAPNGTVTVSNSTLTGLAGNIGGSVIVSGQSVILNNATLNARGDATHSGGGVSVYSNDSLAINGNVALNADANGGSSAGFITVANTSRQGALDITGAGNLNLNADGAGGSVELVAGALSVQGAAVSLHADGSVSGTNAVNVISSYTGMPSTNLVLGDGAGMIKLSANGSTASGSIAGQVFVINSGDLTVQTGAVSVAAAGPSGKGGNVDLQTGSGTAGNLYLDGDLSANGAGTGSGGNITIKAQGSIQNELPANISATGANGGSIAMTAANGAISLNAANLDVSGPNAGTMTLSAGTDVNFSGGTVLNASSSQSSGGSISVSAGSAGIGALSLDGSILANGVAGGGNITLTQSSNSAMLLGPATGTGTGIISASSSAGSGGTLTLSNLNNDLNVSLNESVHLDGANQDLLGVVKVDSAANSVNISGAGTLSGSFSGAANSYSIIVDGAGSVLGVTNLSARTGNITLKASAADSSLVFASGSSIDALFGAVEIGAAAMHFRGNATISMDDAGVLKVNSGNQTNSLNMDFADGSIVTFNVTQGTSLRPGVVQLGPNGTGFLSMSTSGSADIEFTGGTVSIISSNGNINLGSGLSLNSDVFDTTQNVGMEIVATNGNINLNSAISARQLNVSTVTSGNINISGDINSPTVVMSVQGNSSINQTGTGIVGIGTLIMSSQNGDIGSSTNPILANVLEVKVNSTGGSVFLSNESSVDVKTSVVAGTLQLSNTGDVSIESNVSAGSLAVTATGNISMTGSASGMNGVVLAVSSGNNIDIGAGMQLSSSSGSILLNTDNLILDGSILAQAANAQVSVSSNSTLSLSGSSGRITATGAASLINLSGTSVNFGTSYILNAGASGTVQVQTASLSPSGVSIANGASITAAGGSQLNVFTNALSFGTGSAINVSNSTNGLSVVSTGGAPLVVSVVSGATINSSAGGAVRFLASVGAPLTFQTAGLGTGSLSIVGGQLVTSSTAANTSINNININSSSGMQIAVNGGVLNLNGNLTSTQNGGVIVLQDPDGITINGNGTVGFASGMSGTILVQALTAGASLAFSGTPHFVDGVGGTISFTSVGDITFNGSSTTTISGGATLNIQAPKIVFGDHSQVLATGASNVNISGIDSTGVSIVLPSGGSASLSTNGGQFSVSTGTAVPISFDQSVSGGSGSTLNFLGGPVTISNSNSTISISSGVVLSSDNNINVFTPGGSLINNGLIQGTSSSTVISEAGNLVINQGISAYSLRIQTTANNGSITLGADINVQKDLTISANGSGSIIQTSGVLSADSIALLSGSGNIGSSSGRIQLRANTLTVSTGGSAYVNSRGAITVASYNVGGGLDLTSSGNITVGGANASNLTINSDGHFNAGTSGVVTFVASNLISVASGVEINVDKSSLNVRAASIQMGTGSRLVSDGTLSVFGNMSGGNELRLISKGGDIQINGNLSGNNLLVLQSGKNGNDNSYAGNIILNGNVSAPNLQIMAAGSGNVIQQSGKTISSTYLNISSQSGNIGSSQSALNVSSANLTLATSGAGVVNVNASGNVNLGDSQSGGNFTLRAGGNLNTGKLRTSSGSITLESGGAIVTGQSRSIIANEGNLILHSTNAANGSIEIGKNANLQALSSSASNGLGNVYVVVGSMPTNPVKGSATNGITVSEKYGGQVFWGSNGISSDGKNQVNAWGSNVVFSTGARPKSAIKLDGGVYILADPPVASATQQASVNLSIDTVSSASLVSRAVAAPAAFNLQSLQTPAVFYMNSVKSTPETKVLQGHVEREEFKAIACVTGATGATVAAPQNLKAVLEKTASAANSLYTKNCEYEKTASGLILHKGEMLIKANRQTAVRCADTSVSIADGACALLVANGKGVEIYNIYEEHWGGARVRVGEKEFVLGAGQRMTVDSDNNTVAVRNEKSYPTAGRNVKHGEFSLLSLSAKTGLLTNLMHSETKDDRQLAARLLKMAACLSMVTASHGPFQRR